jgi:hypothetical protein
VQITATECDRKEGKKKRKGENKVKISPSNEREGKLIDAGGT